MANEPNHKPPTGGTSPSVASAAVADQNAAELAAELANQQAGGGSSSGSDYDDTSPSGGKLGSPELISQETGGTPIVHTPKTQRAGKAKNVTADRGGRNNDRKRSPESDDGSVHPYYFTRVPKKQRFDVLQRKSDSECFAIGFAQLEQETIQTALNCDNFEDPDKEEAVALAKVCQYAGLKMPAAVYERSEGVSLRMKYVYCSMPFADNKSQVRVHAKAHDRRYELEYDHANNKPKGGISDPHDIALIKVNASQAGFTFNPQSEEPGELQTRIEQLEATVAGQHIELQAFSESLTVAVNEEHNLRGLFKDMTGKKPPRSQDYIKLCKTMNEEKLPVMKVVINGGKTQMRRARLDPQAPYDDADSSIDEGGD